MPSKGLVLQSKAKPAESVMSSSQISNINPLEDPFSDAGAYTPTHHQGGLVGDNGFLNTSEDAEMSSAQQADELQLSLDLVDLLKEESQHFDNVFNHLVTLIEQQINYQLPQPSVEQMAIDEGSSQINTSSPLKREPSTGSASLLAEKQTV